MKVLSIGTDKKLFEENSSVLERQIHYAQEMGELHTIVFTLRKDGLIPTHNGHLHAYPTNSISKLHYIFDAVRLGKKIAKENKLIKGEAVITTQDPSESGFVGYKLKKALGLPLQLQIHTDIFSPHFKNSFLSRIRVKLAKYTIPHADGIRVVSSTISDSLKQTFPHLKAKVDILPIFVDVEKMSAQTNEVNQFSQFDFVIFMASRLAQEKRIDVALGSLKKIITQFPKTGLVISGDGPEKPHIDEWIKELGLEENVVFLGWQENLEPYYAEADIFLLTSEYEGYSMTLIEAGASGCPIVTTEVGVAKTDLFKDGENAFVCPVGDVDCLSKSIIDLIANPEKRKLFKERMQDSIKKQSISKEEYLEKYINLLKELL